MGSRHGSAKYEAGSCSGLRARDGIGEESEHPRFFECGPFADVFLGPEGLGPWQLREHYLALDRQTRDRAFPVIPVLLPGADPPLGFLRLKTWVDLRDGIDDEAALALLRSIASGLPSDPQAATRSNQARAAICPYRGLQVFREEDAPFFCGREHFTRRLAEAVKGDSIVAVVGASGSGKSSVVRAGLLPLLRAGANDREWEIVTLLPGERPHRALAATLILKLEPDPSETDQLVEIGKLADHLATGALSLRDVGQRVLAKQPGTDRLLVFIDQWEELYTLCTDNASRQGFVAQLLDAAKDDLFKIVLTLRGDFFAWPLADRALADALEKAQVNLGPMTRDELARAISSPAATLGLEFEPGLVDRILDDVGDEPGNLPLLEFVLASLWERRRGATLHFEAYQAIGGVKGAIAERADAIFEKKLTLEQRQAARRVLMRMVRPGAGTQDTRKRVPLPTDDETALAVIQHLADARLVVTGRVAAGDTVEVTHEALIQNWGLLRGWVNEDRGFLITRERVEASADLWEKEGRTSDWLLAPGRPLAEAEELLADRRDDLGPGLIQYIQASLTAEKTRQEQERAAERRRLRRARLAAAAMSALALASIALGFFAYWKSEDEQTARLAAEMQTRVAEEERNVADRQRQTAVSRLLAQEASRLSETGREAALIENAAALAVESWRRRKNPTAMAAAMTLLPMLPDFKIPHGGDVNDIAFSRDGSLLATASEDGTASLLATDDGREIARLRDGSEALSVAFSPGGDYLVTDSEDGGLRVFDTANGEHLTRLTEGIWGRIFAFSPRLPATLAWADQDGNLRLFREFHGTNRTRIAPSYPGRRFQVGPKGRRLASVDKPGTLRLTTIPEGKVIAELKEVETIKPVILRFSPDGNYLTATEFGRGKAVLLESHSGRVVSEFDSVRPSSPAFSKDSRFVAFSNDSGHVLLFDLESKAGARELSKAGFVAAFSPDGRFLVTERGYSADGRFTAAWDTATGHEVVRIPIEGFRGWVELGSKLRRMTLGQTDQGTIRLEDVRTREVIATIEHTKHAWSEFSPDGRFVATTSLDGSVKLLDAESGEEILHYKEPGGVHPVTFSSDSRYLGTVTDEGHARLLECETGKTLSRFLLKRSTSTNNLSNIFFSPKNRFVVFGLWNGDARLLATADGRTIAEISELGGKSEDTLLFSRDERLLAVLHENEVVSLYEIQTGKTIGRIRHDRRVADFSFSGDGRLLLTRSFGAVVRLVSTDTVTQVAEYSPEGGVSGAQFVLDGEMVAIGTKAGIKLYPSDPQVLFDSLCAKAGANLSEDEWADYIGVEEPWRATCPNWTSSVIRQQ